MTSDASQQAIDMEISSWMESNSNGNIHVEYTSNRRVVVKSIKKHQTNYKITIWVPKKYPDNKQGFSCRQTDTGLIRIADIKRINKLISGKKLVLEKVLSYVAKYLRKHIENMEDSSVVVENDNAILESEWDIEMQKSILESDIVIVDEVMKDYESVISDSYDANDAEDSKRIDKIIADTESFINEMSGTVYESSSETADADDMVDVADVADTIDSLDHISPNNEPSEHCDTDNVSGGDPSENCDNDDDSSSAEISIRRLKNNTDQVDHDMDMDCFDIVEVTDSSSECSDCSDINNMTETFDDASFYDTIENFHEATDTTENVSWYDAKSSDRNEKFATNNYDFASPSNDSSNDVVRDDVSTEHENADSSSVDSVCHEGSANDDACSNIVSVEHNDVYTERSDSVSVEHNDDVSVEHNDGPGIAVMDVLRNSSYFSEPEEPCDSDSDSDSDSGEYSASDDEPSNNEPVFDIDDKLKLFSTPYDTNGIYRRLECNNTIPDSLQKFKEMTCPLSAYFFDSECKTILSRTNSIKFNYLENSNYVLCEIDEDYFDCNIGKSVIFKIGILAGYPLLAPTLLMTGGYRIGIIDKFSSIPTIKKSVWSKDIGLSGIIKSVKIFVENNAEHMKIYASHVSSTRILEVVENYNHIIGHVKAVNNEELYADILAMGKKSINTSSNTPQGGTGIGYGYGYIGSVDDQDNKNVNELIMQVSLEFQQCISSIDNVDYINLSKVLIGSPFHKFLIYFFSTFSAVYVLSEPSLFIAVMDSIRILPNNMGDFYVSDINGKNIYSPLSDMLASIGDHVMTFVDDHFLGNMVHNFTKLCDKIKNNLPNDIETIAITENLEKRDDYVEQLSPFASRENHNIPFTTADNGSKKIDKMYGSITTSCMKKVARELIAMPKELPIHRGSSIFHTYNPIDLRFHEFVITGPEDTPYDSGIFHFGMFTGNNYPENPPTVATHTTDSREKFNPNLYTNGYVCLSLLGTWRSPYASESWNPKISNMMQVMLSIQSMIFVSDPYYNETGREVGRSNDSMKSRSDAYNRLVEYMTIEIAMIRILESPPAGFEEIVKKHFSLKKDHIIETCGKWVNHPSAYNRIRESYQKLRDLLHKLG